MLFNSIEFLLFFPIVTLLYFLLPYKFRWALLLVASCYFYMAFVPIYILILGFTIVIDYFAAIYIDKAKGKNRKRLLIISLISNVGILAIFKYYNFINENLSFLVELFGHSNPIPFLEILLPIGLSFHTFQAMSYTIEVYRGKQKPETHFGIYSLYVMFYPQLVAGPIERPQNIIHQFREKHDFEYDRVVAGLKLMLWGMFKKIVIADRLAIAVNTVYDKPYEFEGIPLIMASIMFAFQIYCDFSGYSDIAIGSAKVMGFKLMNNFDRPYSSQSIPEFWRRWHISLSSWFKDYVYVPLGGNRAGKFRWQMNLFIVFLISGLWHGANWTYIIWGGLHGLYLVFMLTTSKFRESASKIFFKNIPKVQTYFNILITFSLVCFSWIFFRAKNLENALYISGNLFSNTGTQIVELINDTGDSRQNYIYLGTGMFNFMYLVFFVSILQIIESIKSEENYYYSFKNKPIWIRWGFFSFLILSIFFFGAYHTQTDFIYFQF